MGNRLKSEIEGFAQDKALRDAAKAEKVAKALKLKADGLGPSQISARLGVCTDTIRVWLKGAR